MKTFKNITVLAVIFVLVLSLGALAWDDGVYTGEAMGHNGPIEVEVMVEDGKIISIDLVEHAETPVISDAGFEVFNEIIASQSLDVDAVSGATVTSEAAIAAVRNAFDTSSSLVDGTYTGEGEGFNGPITVEVEVEEGQIISITVLSHDETPMLSDVAVDGIPTAIIEAQSTDVDTIAGATSTSKGIIEAVNDALSGE